MGGWKMAGENMCIFIFCLHNVRPSFSIEISTVFAKNQSQTATPRAIAMGASGTGANGFQLDVVYMVLTAFHTPICMCIHPKHPVEKQLSPGISFTFRTPKIYHAYG